MTDCDQSLYASLAGAGRVLLAAFTGLTEPQRLAIPAILARRNTLVVARTAAGKTECALSPLCTLCEDERWSGRPVILYVAPTRALVNDLYARLAPKLDGWMTVGRKTGEHDEREAQLLVTTPESLDSMLARGKTDAGHFLADVRAIVLDELHALAESARGAQVQALLARLDHVTGRAVLRVALSATVPSPAALAVRFLGPDAAICLGREARAVQLEGPEGPIEVPARGEGIDPLAGKLLRQAVDARPLAERILSVREREGNLKAVVFVPSRARCDRLTQQLGEALRGRAPVRVLAHHASLDRGHREAVERTLAGSDEVVAVATSTLELGIDVGDLDLIVLDGAPGSVSALLQRIGRGNRRTGATRVLPVARDELDAVTLASMLRAAIDGELDPAPVGAHYSIALQQAASMLLRAGRGLSQPHLQRVLSPSWGEETAAWIVDELLRHNALQSAGHGRMVAGPALAEVMDQPQRLHANLGDSGAVMPLVDGLTGETLAWVPRGQPVSPIVLAGATYTPRACGSSVELHPNEGSSQGASLRYATKAAPLGRNALRHRARGLGFGDDTLVVQDGRHHHFGGALFARMLTVAGLASGATSSSEDPRRLAPVLATVAAQHYERFESLCGFGPFHAMLPASVRREAVKATVEGLGLREWLEGMRVVGPTTKDQLRLLAAQ